MYFSAQRAYGFGAVYEVTGPFAGAAAAATPATAAPLNRSRRLVWSVMMLALEAGW
jgi:hypothetical protein